MSILRYLAHNTALWMILAALVLVVVQPGLLFAQANNPDQPDPIPSNASPLPNNVDVESIDCFREAIRRGFVWTSPCDQPQSAIACGAFRGVIENTNVPQESVAQFEAALPKILALQADYQTAAASVGIPWELLAAIHFRESGNDPNGSLFAGEPFGTLNPDHKVVFGYNRTENYSMAARFLTTGLDEFPGLGAGMVQIGYPEVTPGLTNTFEELQKIFLAWNRGRRYVNRGLEPDTSPYVMNGFDADHLNMRWQPPADTVSGVDARIGAMTVFVLLSDQELSGGGNCGGANGAAPGGLYFPLGLPKSWFLGGDYYYTPVNCVNSAPNTCHHDYYAADLGAPVGTTVFSATDGIVYSATDVGSCSTSAALQFKVPKVTIETTDSATGKKYYYYYTHMQPGSVAGLTKGSSVKQGDVLGKVGPSTCAQGTLPHLHFDITTQTSVSRSRGEPVSSGKGYQNSLNGLLLDPMPGLQEAFEYLPDN